MVSWAPDYCTSAELKSYLRIEDSSDDVFVGLWITTVSRTIDEFCGRQFGQVATAEARTFTPVWDGRQHVTYLDDVQDITGLAVVDSGGTTIAAADYTLAPINRPARGRPYEQLLTTASTGDVTITALWGWTAVPAAVRVAVLLQGSRLAARRDSPFGISGSPSEQGEVRLLAQLDPDLRTSLRPFLRRWWVG